MLITGTDLKSVYGVNDLKSFKLAISFIVDKYITDNCKKRHVWEGKEKGSKKLEALKLKQDSSIIQESELRDFCKNLKIDLFKGIYGKESLASYLTISVDAVITQKFPDLNGEILDTIKQEQMDFLAPYV